VTPEQADDALLSIAIRSADTERLALEARVRLACAPGSMVSKAVEAEVARLSLDSKGDRAELLMVLLAIRLPWWRRWWPF